MKIIIVLVGLVTLMLGAGCTIEEGHRGGYYGTYDGEYPHRYYGHEGYYHHHPFDRDHYWDNGYRY